MLVSASYTTHCHALTVGFLVCFLHVVTGCNHVQCQMFCISREIGWENCLIVFEVIYNLSLIPSQFNTTLCVWVCLSVYVCMCLSVCLCVSVYVSVCLCVVLVLSHNQIAHIDVATLSQLVNLQLSHNTLKAFPDVRV